MTGVLSPETKQGEGGVDDTGLPHARPHDDDASISTPTDYTSSEKGPTRRCLVSGLDYPRAKMVRFVVAADGVLYPDIGQKLPGRGLWIYATIDNLQLAIKKNMFTRAAKRAVHVPENLLSETARLLRKRCLEAIGLAKRAGQLVHGQPQVEEALRKTRLGMVITAHDAGTQLDTKSIFDVKCFNRLELGAVLGHDQLVYVGVLHGSFARHLMELIELYEPLQKLYTPTPLELDSERP